MHFIDLYIYYIGESKLFLDEKVGQIMTTDTWSLACVYQQRAVPRGVRERLCYWPKPTHGGHHFSSLLPHFVLFCFPLSLPWRPTSIEFNFFRRQWMFIYRQTPCFWLFNRLMDCMKQQGLKICSFFQNCPLYRFILVNVTCQLNRVFLSSVRLKSGN